MKRRHFAAAGLAIAVAMPCMAQTFPTKPLTIVVPASPGGAIDLAARVIGQKMTEAWGQPVVIDNRAGASGIIGTDLIAKASPDGHMLVLVASSHAINPSLFKKLPFDTVKSFEPVALTHIVPLVMVVSPTVPMKTVKEVIAFGKANPGQLTFASSGKGGAPHMSGELFKTMAGIDMTHVPYKGSTLAHPDLISGRTSLMFDTVAAVKVQVQSDRLRALAVTSAKRSSVLPNIPTMQESGVAGYETTTWGGLLAPAGTPKPVVAKLNAEVNKILQMPDVRKTLAEAGIEPGSGTSQQFVDFLAAESVKWGKVAKDAGIQPE
ncbi:tripartite tricarboxylate transporter substrate binding protein [Variovorax sp. LT1R16]|uniref:tripartite tricarboxylate transporter substrate binding protein n=1 Tax=Variovorax sp. LT1R16 TaxID=3443728 RepID=UPI003F4552EA